ncbi:MAG: ABC transporter permease [Thermoplasmata archaeon]
MMGIDPIEYSPWEEKEISSRFIFLIILKKVFKQKIKSRSVWAILIIGSILVHVFPILFSVLVPQEELTKELLFEGGLIGAYLKGEVFFVFTILLAAVVSSDLISQDLRDNSLILYFSRSLDAKDYLIGKLGGALGIMTIYCALPPFLVGLAVIATQTSNAYLGSFEILGLTFLAGLFTSFVFLPYALLISSLTERKAYSGIGTFTTFFVLTIGSEFFSTFDSNWRLLGPSNLLNYSYDLIYGSGLPSDIDGALYSVAIAAMILIPLAFTLHRLYSKEVGR